jgi:protein MpaA
MNFVELKSGTSVEGLPITAFRSGHEKGKHIYLMAGVHGDEVEGVYVLEQLFNWLKLDQEIDLPILIIPILNIDGYRNSRRVNSNGVDLNRNFPTRTWTSEFVDPAHKPGNKPFSEPENKFLSSFFKKYPPGFILSFHSWKPILNYNGDCLDVAQFLAQNNSYPVADDIGYPTPGSLGTYGPENLKSPVLTFECPKLDQGKTLNEIWLENKKGLIQLFTEKKLHRFLA